MIDAAAIGAMVRELAMQAECFAVIDAPSEQLWRLRVERENLRAPPLRERLQAALGEALQRPVRIDVEAGVPVDSPAERQAAERAPGARPRLEQNDPRRPARQGAAGAVQDRAHRSGLGQAAMNFEELQA